MGRPKGFTISKEQKRKMQEGRRRAWANPTYTLEKVVEIVKKRAVEDFYKWHVSLDETIFTVTGCDWDSQPIERFWEDVKGLDNAIKKAVVVLQKPEVKWILIWCAEEKVLAETKRTGNVIQIIKDGLRFRAEIPAYPI